MADLLAYQAATARQLAYVRGKAGQNVFYQRLIGYFEVELIWTTDQIVQYRRTKPARKAAPAQKLAKVSISAPARAGA
jgi:hypothetical protein